MEPTELGESEDEQDQHDDERQVWQGVDATVDVPTSDDGTAGASGFLCDAAGSLCDEHELEE